MNAQEKIIIAVLAFVVTLFVAELFRQHREVKEYSQKWETRWKTIHRVYDGVDFTITVKPPNKFIDEFFYRFTYRSQDNYYCGEGVISNKDTPMEAQIEKIIMSTMIERNQVRKKAQEFEKMA